MRQLITRIDDDLHERLKARARAEGRSLNALVVEALADATREPGDERERLRARLLSSGVLVTPPQPARVRSRASVIAATRGAGAAVSEELAAERGAR